MSRDDWLKDCACSRVSFYDLRTVESYKECLTVLENINAEHYKGVKKESQFNKPKHYHVCAPGLAPCSAHDLYLGIVPFDVAIYMKYLIEQEKWLTYQELNFRIKNFSYAQADKNRPAGFSEKNKKLSGTAAEIRCLLKLLPLMIIDKIQGESDVWENLLLLSHVSDYVCAPHIHPSFLPLMQELIDLYVEQRLKLFPKVPIRPKHHFLTHYPALTESFGPLIHVWTLEFERAHHPYKRATRSSRNFKNVTKSLSVRHQLNQASHYSGIPLGLIMMDGEVEFSLQSYSETIQSAIRQAQINAVFDCRSVQYKGTKYVKGCVIVTGQSFYESEVNFGRVHVLLSDGIEQLYLVVEVFVGVFHKDLRSYTLSEPIGFLSVKANALLFSKYLQYG